jgi:putative transposase
MNSPVVMNLKKIRRLMDKFNLSCPIRKANPYRQMAKALKTSNVTDNLLQREFECYGPRMVLLTDITYLPYNGKFAYLSTILDAYTKQILAYVLSNSFEVDFVLETVNQLIDNHGISLTAATIVHSDQGCHYTSYSFVNILKDKCLRQSMSRKGNCWDNAPQKSFFGPMKDHIKEELAPCLEFYEVKDIVDRYMNYYNNQRYQWQLAKLSPNEFYKFYTTGTYPLDIPNKPAVPIASKSISELGAGKKSRDSMSALIYSLIQTAIANNLKPLHYMVYIFAQIQKVSDLKHCYPGRILFLRNARSKSKSIPPPESLYWNVVFFNRRSSVDTYEYTPYLLYMSIF